MDRSTAMTLHITVIIPTHNRPVLLDACMGSLARQTFRDFDVLVVNTGSPTPDLRKYEDRVNFKVIQAAKDNLANAYNSGIAATSSSIVVFVDDDVTVPESWLELFADLILKTPQSAAWAGPVIELGHRRTRTILKSKSLFARIGFRLFDIALMEGRAGEPAQISSFGATSLGTFSPVSRNEPEWSARVTAPSNANLAVSRQALVELGGFDERFNFSYQEGDLYLRMKSSKLIITMGSGPYLFHHIGGDGKTRRIEPHARDFEVFLRVISSRAGGLRTGVRLVIQRIGFLAVVFLTTREDRVGTLGQALRGFAAGRREFRFEPLLPFRGP